MEQHCQRLTHFLKCTFEGIVDPLHRSVVDGRNQGNQLGHTLPETTMAPENAWLEHYRFSFGMTYFQGPCSFWGVYGNPKNTTAAKILNINYVPEISEAIRQYLDAFCRRCHHMC